MAQSIRYWLKCSGMTDESVRTVIRLTDLGGMILSKDPYFEKTFSLWMLHCNIARNRRLATAWQLFFNEFGDGEFTRQEMKYKMLKLAEEAAEGEKISARSVGHDCDAILCMYAVLLKINLLCRIFQQRLSYIFWRSVCRMGDGSLSKN